MSALAGHGTRSSAGRVSYLRISSCYSGHISDGFPNAGTVKKIFEERDGKLSDQGQVAGNERRFFDHLIQGLQG